MKQNESIIIARLLDNNLTNREKGDIYEDYIYNKITDFGMNIRKTKGSGSVHGNADITTDNITIDCKFKKRNMDMNNSKSISVKRNEAEKVRQQASDSSKTGIIITQLRKNRNKLDNYVIIELEDFLELVSD